MWAASDSELLPTSLIAFTMKTAAVCFAGFLLALSTVAASPTGNEKRQANTFDYVIVGAGKTPMMPSVERKLQKANHLLHRHRGSRAGRSAFSRWSALLIVLDLLVSTH